jgi:biofilm PGA synthesis N-glycosyltransferase PgaC
MSQTNGNGHSSTAYVLVTAAWNEELFIERTLQSVIKQTVRPLKWIIVSDGSTDRTDEMVRGYAEKYGFIQLHRIEEEHPRDFVAHVIAMNVGFSLLKELTYDFIGNLDADISLKPTYFARLLGEFERDPDLGLAGGYLYEEHEGEFCCRRMNRTWSVANGIQLFRRECLEAVRGYAVLPYGSPDWHAEVSVRMRGWRVQSFPELKVFHHRPTGTAGGLLRTCYREGLKDYLMGSHPVYELFRVGRRLPERPFVIGALVRLTGFAWARLSGQQRRVSEEFIRFLRKEEIGRVLGFMRGYFRKSNESETYSHQKYGSENAKR